jgi:hypothetical protein
LENLIELAEQLCHSPSQDEMNEKGEHCSKTYNDRFGSWNNAKKAAGLDIRNPGENRSKPGRDPIPEKDLLGELNRLAEDLGDTPGIRDMDASGEYCSEVYERRFGSWNNALREAGLRPKVKMGWSEEELIENLQRIAEELGRTPHRNEIRNHGPVSSMPYRRVFESWNDAVEQAGLEKNVTYGISEYDLLSELNRLAEDLDRSPTRQEMTKIGRYSGGIYWEKFGSWNEALRKAGLNVNKLNEVSKKELLSEIQRIADKLEKVPTRDDLLDNTQYSIHWYQKNFQSLDKAFREAIPDRYGRKLLDIFQNSHLPEGDNWEMQREKALKRDGFQCLRCGLTREKHKETTNFDLHVHHRRPRKWYYKKPNKDIEDANQLSNLITLCSSCHKKLESLPVQPKPPETIFSKVS